MGNNTNDKNVGKGGSVSSPGIGHSLGQFPPGGVLEGDLSCVGTWALAPTKLWLLTISLNSIEMNRRLLVNKLTISFSIHC